MGADEKPIPSIQGFEVKKTCPCRESLQTWKGPGIDPEGEKDKARAKARSEGGFFDYNQPIKTLNLNTLFAKTKDNPNNADGYYYVDQNCPTYGSNCTNCDKVVRIAIIDSGIEHTGLESYVVQPTTPTCYKPNFSTNPISNGYDDVIAHGTHVAGIIAEEWPDSIRLELIPFKIFGNNDSADLFDAVCAIYTAIEMQVDVINLSWGFKYKFTPEVLQEALFAAARSKIYVVCSSGNHFLGQGGTDNDGIWHWPSNFSALAHSERYIVATGSYNADLDVYPYTYVYSDFANYGDHTVDLAAHGKQINSAFPPDCLLYTSPSPRDQRGSRMPSSA